MSLRNYSSVIQDMRLLTAVDDTATTFDLQTPYPDALPAVPFVAIIERGTDLEEAVLVTAKASDRSSLTVTRAFDSTVAVDHSAWALIEHGVTAIEFREANTHVNAVADVHGVTGNLKTYIDSVASPSSALPVGSVIAFAGLGDIPDGWLLCDGSLYSWEEYPLLSAVLFSDFTPNLVGQFIQGGTTDRGIDGSNTRTLTIENMPDHDHGGATYLGGEHSHTTGQSGTHTHPTWLYSRQVYEGTGTSCGVNQDGVTGGDPTLAGGNHTHTVSTVSHHTHAIYGQGEGQEFDIQPQRYIMRYIIKAN